MMKNMHCGVLFYPYLFQRLGLFLFLGDMHAKSFDTYREILHY